MAKIVAFLTIALTMTMITMIIINDNNNNIDDYVSLCRILHHLYHLLKPDGCWLKGGGGGFEGNFGLGQKKTEKIWNFCPKTGYFWICLPKNWVFLDIFLPKKHVIFT